MLALRFLVFSATAVLQKLCILLDGGLDEACTTLLHLLVELERERFRRQRVTTWRCRLGRTEQDMKVHQVLECLSIQR